MIRHARRLRSPGTPSISGGDVIRIHEQRTIDMARDEAFQFIGDFSNVVDWDPGITASEKIGSDPVNVGTEFAVVSNFAGRALPLTYVVESWNPPAQVVLFTTTSRFDGRDTISLCRRRNRSRLRRRVHLHGRHAPRRAVPQTLLRQDRPQGNGRHRRRSGDADHLATSVSLR